MTQVHVITAANRDLYSEVLEQTHKIRHNIFVGELGWEALRRSDGRDVDAYDDADTTYLIAIDNQRVVGGQRLRPTTSPHLLGDVFPHLADVKGVPVADDIWEWSRYFVVRERRSGRTDCRLLAAIQQFALEEGLTQLQAIVETWWLPRWHEAGFRVRPLGLPTLIENRWSIAALIDVSADTLNRVRDFAGLTGDTLIREGSQGSTTRGIIHAA